MGYHENVFISSINGLLLDLGVDALQVLQPCRESARCVDITHVIKRTAELRVQVSQSLLVGLAQSTQPRRLRARFLKLLAHLHHVHEKVRANDVTADLLIEGRTEKFEQVDGAQMRSAQDRVCVRDVRCMVGELLLLLGITVAMAVRMGIGLYSQRHKMVRIQLSAYTLGLGKAMRAHHDTPVRALQLLEIEVKAALAPRNTSRGTDEHRTNVCAVQMRARAPPLVAAKSGQSPAWPSRSLGAGGKLIASCGAEDTSDRYETRAQPHVFQPTCWPR